MASNNDTKWLANFEALRNYVALHHHLPPKNAGLNEKYLLNWAKYVRKTINEGRCAEWKKEMFKGLMATRDMVSHTGGRKKSLGEVQES